MKRRILTYTNVANETEDLIPYVDGYAVIIGGTNLVDYLNQIEQTYEKAKLNLGAFASESALLTAYPNGSDIEEGSYAIVTDTDTLYLYDTDGEEWLPTASNISGILTLNGLTADNGVLVITGGDINATVSSADTQTQTITAHLNTLYEENDTQDESITAIQGQLAGTIETLTVTETEYYSLAGRLRYTGTTAHNSDYIHARVHGLGYGYTDPKAYISFIIDNKSYNQLLDVNGKYIRYCDLFNPLGGNATTYIDLILKRTGNLLYLINKTVDTKEIEYAFSNATTTGEWTLSNEEYSRRINLTDYFDEYDYQINGVVYMEKTGNRKAVVADYNYSGVNLWLYADTPFAGKVRIAIKKVR